MIRFISVFLFFLMISVDIAFSVNLYTPDPDSISPDDYEFEIFSKKDFHDSISFTGSFHIFTQDTVEQVIDENGIEKPTSARLSQNYPNPFNPATTIAFQLVEYSNVRIEIFDQLGRSVDLALQEHRNAGEHDLVYDASHLPSGVYIYRMEIQSHESSHHQVFTRKFTLLK